MSQLNDAKLLALQTELAITGGAILDLEADWLLSRGAVGSANNDLWFDYLLNIEGVPAGGLSDMKRNWLSGLGFTGSLNDMFLAYWVSLAP